MYSHAYGPFVVQIPIGRQCPRIEPEKATAQFGELKPMILTAEQSEMPRAMRDLAKLQDYQQYFLQFHVIHLLGEASKLMALFSGNLSTACLHISQKVQGFSDPGPDFLMRTGNSTLQSAVHKKFLSGQEGSQFLRIQLSPQLEISIFSSCGKLGKLCISNKPTEIKIIRLILHHTSYTIHFFNQKLFHIFGKENFILFGGVAVGWVQQLGGGLGFLGLILVGVFGWGYGIWVGFLIVQYIWIDNSGSDRNMDKKLPISFPTLNIYCCPRFYKGLIVADGRMPLSKYLPKITAENCKKIIQDDTPQRSQITNFQPGDGLLHFLGKLTKKSKQHGGYYFKGIKCLICVCMYNQSKFAIETTLGGIYSNLPHLSENGITEDDIAVVLVQDGILKLIKDRATREYAKGASSMIQFYRELDRREGKDRCQLEERLHIIMDELDNFDRKRMSDFYKNNHDFPPSIEKSLSFIYQNLWSPNVTDQKKLKIISCFKHTNGTKLSSHLWFFQGFCRQFNPQICILLDVGTKPSPKGILKLIAAFEDKNCGGVTGFMSVDANFQSEEGEAAEATNCFKNMFFSVEKAQEFQYIISHFIDKNFESALGFLHVLPGAWSGYRYEALIHGQKFQQNLLQRKYFKMILDPNHQQRDYRQANMYLAQDRILSLGIYCQQDRKYTLKYIPDAIAYTDPMKSHQQLMIQRRRWINSSYFAFMYVFRNYYYNAMQSSHNFMRKYILLGISMILALISFINGYLIPAFYLFALYTTIVQSASNIVVQYAAQVLTLLYVFMIILCVVWSLFGTQWTKKAHYISAIFSFYTFLVLGLVIYNVVGVYLQVEYIHGISDFFKDSQSVMVFIITSINIVSYIIIAIIHMPTHFKFVFRLLVDVLSYLAYQGAYSHVMLIYAFCNVDNVSWGTKGNSGQRVTGYLIEKVKFIADWLFYNALLAFIFLYIDFFMPRDTKKGVILLAIGIYATAILFIKIVLAVGHQMKWLLFQKCCSRIKYDKFRLEKLKKFWQQSYELYESARV